MIKRWIINVIDKSGSMINLKKTVINEYNVFLKEIKNEQHDIRWTSILFNDNVDFLNDDSVKNIHELQDNDYIPERNTAMLDAIGKACLKIVDNSVEYNDIVMNIFTDGCENASSSYTYVSVNDLLNSVKNKYSFTTNFYCTTKESLDVACKIPSIDTTYINNNFHDCMRQMSSNSQSIHDHNSQPASYPQIKRQKRT